MITKNLLKKILNTLVIILLMRLDQFIIIVKKKSKGIYGSASKEDLKELKEEGIEAQLIPWIDENEN